MVGAVPRVGLWFAEPPPFDEFVIVVRRLASDARAVLLGVPRGTRVFKSPIWQSLDRSAAAVTVVEFATGTFDGVLLLLSGEFTVIHNRATK